MIVTTLSMIQQFTILILIRDVKRKISLYIDDVDSLKSSQQYVWLNVEYNKHGITSLIKNMYYKLVKTSKTKI